MEQDNQSKYDAWLTEDFLLNEIVRTPHENAKLEKLYDYLMMMKEFEEMSEDCEE